MATWHELTHQAVDFLSEAADDDIPCILDHLDMDIDTGLMIPPRLVTRPSGRSTMGRKVGASSQSPVPDAAAEGLEVWLCKGAALDRLGVPLYCEVRFASSLVRAQRAYWMQATFAHEGSKEAISELLDRLPGTVRQVYIAAESAAPGREFCAVIQQLARHIESLFAHFYGQDNPRHCWNCSTRFFSTRTATGELVGWPYPECRSLRDFRGNICSCCLYHGLTTCEYTWAALGRPQLFASRDDGSDAADRGLENTDGILNHETAPRVSMDWAWSQRQKPSGTAGKTSKRGRAKSSGVKRKARSSPRRRGKEKSQRAV